MGILDVNEQKIISHKIVIIHTRSSELTDYLNSLKYPNIGSSALKKAKSFYTKLFVMHTAKPVCRYTLNV